MVMYVDSKKVEKRLIEQGQRTQLAKEYPTCLYAGVELRLRIVFNEEEQQGRKACCTHKGKFHLLYY
jgi:hypothetical protein